MTRPVSRSSSSTMKVSFEGVGNASGEGNAVRRQGKIKVVREAVQQHIPHRAADQVDFLIRQDVTDFVDQG